MTIEAINEQLLRAVGVGIALFDEQTLCMQFRNDVFVTWFGEGEPDETLASVFPELDIVAMRAAVEDVGRFTNELSFRKKRRTLVIAQTFTRTTVGDHAVYVLECQNISRIRELEAMISSYSTMVERNTRDIQREKEQVEKLLLNIMPRVAYDEYKAFGVVAPKKYNAVSVLVLDFVDFSQTIELLPPATFVSELNELYTSFDRIGEQFGCERIKTTGDTYLCIAGLHDATGDHAAAVANAAVRFVRYLKRRNENAETKWRCRIGIGSGAVVGSVVGVQKYVYDIFGPAVNAAMNARGHAAEMEVLLSPESANALANTLDLVVPANDDAIVAKLMALGAI